MPSADGKPAVAALTALGLCDRFEDVVSLEDAVLVSALVRPKAGRLRKSETKALAAKIITPLFAAWSGVDGDRPEIVDAELTRLGLLASASKVVAAAAAGALRWLEARFNYRQAAGLPRPVFNWSMKRG